jgi:hypothetical protein
MTPADGRSQTSQNEVCASPRRSHFYGPASVSATSQIRSKDVIRPSGWLPNGRSKTATVSLGAAREDVRLALLSSCLPVESVKTTTFGPAWSGVGVVGLANVQQSQSAPVPLRSLRDGHKRLVLWAGQTRRAHPVISPETKGGLLSLASR